MKQKNEIKRIVLAVIISVMIFGVPVYAAAEEPAFSYALYANPPPVPMSKQTAAFDDPTLNQIKEGTGGDREFLPDLLPAAALMLPPGGGGQPEWSRPKVIDPQSLIDPVEAYNRTDTNQSLLGFSWDRDGGSRNKWNIVFGLGLYISNYHNGYHPADDFGPEGPVSDRDQMDLIEKIQNVLQVVGFQVRYDF